MNQIKALLGQLSLRQKISILVAVAIVGLLLTTLVKWRKEGDFKPLYTGLAQEDASAVVQKLKEGGIEYRLSEESGTVLVPSGRIPETRLAMAGAGLPKTGRIGFELFDKTNFGATDFTEQVNYRRALEGELERSVMGIGAVERARIHVTAPKESVFLESRQPAKASVMLHLRTGSQLTPQNVAAINYLVSSAVEGLAPDAVTIVDERGNLLSRPRRAGGPDGVESSSAALEYRQQLERDLLNKVNHTLEPLVGIDKYRVGVSVDCDLTSGEQSEELVDPKNSAPVTSQKTEESSGAGTTAGGGVPGTASSLPRPATPPSPRVGGGILRTTENLSFQNSRVVKHTKLPQGAVKRVSVAVLIDNNVRWQGTGAKAKRIVEPPPPERLKVIRDLVAATIGFNEQRADQLIVESLPFESTLNQPGLETPGQPSPGPSGSPLEQLLKDPKILGTAGAVLGMAVLAGVLFMALRGRRRKVAATVSGPAQLAAGKAGGVPATTRPGAAPQAETEAIEKRLESKIAERQAIQEAAELDAMNSLKVPSVSTKKADVLAKHIRDEVKKDPRSSAQLIRSWLNDT